MTSGSNQNESNETLLEELTAYLDGELDQASIDRVEQRLSDDPEYRAEMQSLQKTWDLLDRLPDVEPSRSFTQTTMEMVASELSKKKKKAGWTWSWALRIAALLAIPALVFALTAGMIRNYQNQSNSFLVEELSLVSHYELYRLAKNDQQFVDGLMEEFASTYEFNLENANSFKADETPILLSVGDGEIKPVAAEPEKKIEFISHLTDEEKDHLRKQLDIFKNFSDEERASFKAFDRETQSRADAPMRLMAMRDYYDWLQRVEAQLRIKMLDLEPDECLERIRRLRVKGPAFDNMPPGDIDIVLKWYEDVCKNSEKKIREHFLNSVNENARRKGKEPPPGLKRNSRRGDLSWLLDFLIGLDRNFVEETLLDDDPQFLRVTIQSLSHKTRNDLESRTRDEVRDLVMSWVESVNQSKYAVSWQELARFRDSSLSEVEKQRLMRLSKEDYPIELEKLYRKKMQDFDIEVRGLMGE